MKVLQVNQPWYRFFRLSGITIICVEMSMVPVTVSAIYSLENFEVIRFYISNAIWSNFTLFLRWNEKIIKKSEFDSAVHDMNSRLWENFWLVDMSLKAKNILMKILVRILYPPVHFCHFQLKKSFFVFTVISYWFYLIQCILNVLDVNNHVT